MGSGLRFDTPPFFLFVLFKALPHDSTTEQEVNARSNSMSSLFLFGAGAS